MEPGRIAKRKNCDEEVVYSSESEDDLLLKPSCPEDSDGAAEKKFATLKAEFLLKKESKTLTIEDEINFMKSESAELARIGKRTADGRSALANSEIESEWQLNQLFKRPRLSDSDNSVLTTVSAIKSGADELARKIQDAETQNQALKAENNDLKRTRKSLNLKHNKTYRENKSLRAKLSDAKDLSAKYAELLRVAGRLSSFSGHVGWKTFLETVEELRQAVDQVNQQVVTDA